MVDHHLYEGERSTPTMDEKRGVFEHVQLGGAATIVALFEAARRRIEKERADAESLYRQENEQYERDLAAGKQPPKPTKRKARILPEEAYQIALGITTPPTDGVVCPHHAFAVWKPVPKGPKAKNLVWRANLVMGYGNKDENDEPIKSTAPCQATHRPDPIADVPRPTILLLDDAGYVFRHREYRNCWLLPKAGEPAPEWIVLKMSSPVAQGDLFTELHTRFADRVVCIVSAQELRHECIGLSRSLSWEQTIEDLSACLQSNPILERLTAFRHLIVTFGLDGAFWLDRTEMADPQAWLVCDAGGTEGEFAADLEGESFGYHSSFVMAVTRALVEHLEAKSPPPRPDLQKALASGLTAMRDLRENGHGEVGKDAPGGYPAWRLAGTLDGPNGTFARIPVAWPRRSLGSGPTWRIVETTQSALGSSRRPSLLGLARQVALNGTDVLKRVPHARFGDLFTADRLEMEALRSIRRLMRDYRDAKKTKKPLSFGVFGPPGAGKSFGVKQIALNDFGGKDAWLEFNLSQFADSKDLIGAFHQVRDLVLSGVTPVVFWDEFDSQEYRWLQYLLAPMQDGRFQEGQLNHAVGKCVFVFAGGTSHTYADFGPSKHDLEGRQNFRLRKGPDFHSRLDAYYDVLGPNQRRIIDREVLPPPESIRDVNDVCTPLRRAIMLRGQLKCSPAERMDFDPDLVDALLEVSDYNHGARSLEKLVSGLRAGGGPIRRSALPASNQLAMHVDAADFAGLLARNHPFRLADVVEPMAQEIHDTWRDLSEKEGWTLHPLYSMPYADLGPVEKEENRAAARRIPEILGLVGLVVEPAQTAGRKRTSLTDEIAAHLAHHIESLAEAEHDGWMAHRLRNGWRYDKVRDDARKFHPALVAYAKLSEVDKNKDRNSVRHFPEMVERAGYRVAFLGETDAAGTPGNHESAEVKEESKRLRVLFASELREAVERRLQGASIHEIARELGIPERKVRSRIEEAKNILSKISEKDAAPPAHANLRHIDVTFPARSKSGWIELPGKSGEGSKGDGRPPEGSDEPGRPAAPEAVLLGASCPQRVQPGRAFTARFAAYIKSQERSVKGLLKKVSPGNEPILNLQTCRWATGLNVTVRLHSPDLAIETAQESFVWNGERQLLDFDVSVPADVRQLGTVLGFDVLVGGFIVAKLRIDIAIDRDEEAAGETTVNTMAAQTAFASYASKDRLRVLDRIAEIERAGVDIFTDCLSLTPGEDWKPRLEREIHNRELFLLFWSRHASESEWVEWEWRTALNRKGINGIQPHPLETTADAKPPEELKSLHFDDPHMLMRRAYAAMPDYVALKVDPADDAAEEEA